MRTMFMNAVIALFTLLVSFAQAWAADYPTKPVRVMVIYPPGASGDLTMRFVGAELERRWKQPVVIENRPSGGGRIVYEAVARGASDGHTLGWAVSSLTTLPYLIKDLGFSPEKDITGVSLILNNVNAMVIPPSIPATNMKEFVAWVKANPGKSNYGAPGRGTGPHLVFEMLNSIAGTDMTEVQFPGTSQAIQALFRNDVQIVSDVFQSGLTNHQAGKSRVIAVWGVNERAPELPNVQTLSESGVLPFVPLSWQAMIAPASVPKDIIARIAGDVGEIVRVPDMREKIVKATGVRVVGSTTEEFNQTLRTEYKFWGDLVQRLGIKPQ